MLGKTSRGIKGGRQRRGGMWWGKGRAERREEARGRGS